MSWLYKYALKFESKTQGEGESESPEGRRATDKRKNEREVGKFILRFDIKRADLNKPHNNEQATSEFKERMKREWRGNKTH